MYKKIVPIQTLTADQSEQEASKNNNNIKTVEDLVLNGTAQANSPLGLTGFENGRRAGGSFVNFFCVL